MKFSDHKTLETDNFHAKSTEDVLVTLRSEVETGLSTEEATKRIRSHGKNTLVQRNPMTIFVLLRNQFVSPVVWLLAAAAFVAFAFGEWKEGTAVFVVLVINGCIGFFTELRAVRSMEALRAIGNLTTRVRRNGISVLLPAEQLVPGDIVLLEGGDIVTADLRLLEASNLEADESTLTGESLPVSKNIDPVAVDSTVTDRSSMLFKGTAMTRGSGTGIVVATGMQTELGQISKLVSDAQPEHSPLERQLERLSGQLIYFTLATVTIIGTAGVLSGRDIYLMIKSVIALAVAAIPEGLPIVATMALARGMWRMAKQNALIERLAAVETLGATSIILTDKTGTLTENNMRLQELDLPDGLYSVDQSTSKFVLNSKTFTSSDMPGIKKTLAALVLCNNAELGDDEAKPIGDPLEIAFLEVAQSHGMEKIELLKQYPKTGEIAFDSESKKMATIHQDGDKYLVSVKGAPEAVLTNSTNLFEAGTKHSIDKDTRHRWLIRTNEMASRGMRVLAVATKQIAHPDDEIYSELTFLGLLGLYDPPRPDVPEAIRNCRQAGIRVIMITGDHAITAASIAEEIGISDVNPEVIEGRELKPRKFLTETEIKKIRGTNIFARVSPSQKLDLVAIFQSDGNIVAMTGDGVNDAPALKKADIGVAMGLRGTQVARDASAMVLLDDAFKTIITAIREGRIIFRNIQHFVMYLLSCNLSEVLIVGMAILLGLPLPILPLQILFLNLVTDIFPAFALGLGEEDGHVLSARPRNPMKPIITKPMWFEMIAHSLSITTATLGSLVLAYWVLEMKKEPAVTVSFLTIAFAQLWHVFNVRDPRAPVFNNSIVRNVYVWAALGLSTFLLLAAVYIEPIASVMHLHIPTPEAWGLIIIMSLLPVILGQVGKIISANIYQSKK